jgi:hypothetical protein
MPTQQALVDISAVRDLDTKRWDRAASVDLHPHQTEVPDQRPAHANDDRHADSRPDRNAPVRRVIRGRQQDDGVVVSRRRGGRRPRDDGHFGTATGSEDETVRMDRDPPPGGAARRSSRVDLDRAIST